MELLTDNNTYLLKTQSKKTPSATHFQSHTRRDF